MQNRRLTVGVLEAEPGWTILLRQLGVSFEAVKSDQEISPANYSAVIVNRPLSPDTYAAVQEYIMKGGAVLDRGFFHEKMESVKIREKRVRTLYPGTDNPLFRSVWLLDIFDNVNRYSAAPYFNKTVALTEMGAGCTAFVGLDVNRLYCNSGSKRKQFYTPSGKFPNEIVSLVSKGEIRKLIDAVLKWLHIRRGMPYVHKWLFPRRLQNIFCFRLDTDGASVRQMNEWYRIARNNSIRITWFVHGEPMEDMFPVLHEMENQEFALHGYHHRNYASTDDNRNNIQRNKEQFESAGLDCAGFSAPYGTWSQTLAEAIERHGLLYSSEFSLDYDSVPSYPWLGERFAHTMQIPVHPVCAGSFIRVKASEEEMIRHYRYMTDKKLAHREPVIYYDHPLHAHSNVTDEIFKMIHEKKLENMTFADYARWWDTRERASFKASVSGSDALEVELGTWHNDLSLHITLDDEETFIITGGKYSFKDLLWKPVPGYDMAVPPDVADSRKFNGRVLQYNLIDTWTRRK